MSNWTILTVDDLKAVAFGGIIDAAQASAAGAVDPVAEAMADAVAVVRGAISTGNVLDQNPAAVPRSLRPLAARTAVFALMERVQIDLNADQRATRLADQARLTRIGDQKQRFEQADHPADSVEMQIGSTIDTVADGNSGNSRAELSGL